jgi:hypothetical protein
VLHIFWWEKKKNFAIIIKSVAYILVGKRKSVAIDDVSVAYILLENNKSVAIHIKKCCLYFIGINKKYFIPY